MKNVVRSRDWRSIHYWSEDNRVSEIEEWEESERRMLKTAMLEEMQLLV